MLKMTTVFHYNNGNWHIEKKCIENLHNEKQYLTDRYDEHGDNKTFYNWNWHNKNRYKNRHNRNRHNKNRHNKNRYNGNRYNKNWHSKNGHNKKLLYKMWHFIDIVRRKDTFNFLILNWKILNMWIKLDPFLVKAF